MTSLNEPALMGWSEVRKSPAPVSGPVERTPEAQDRWDRRGDIIDEVGPLPGEPVLLKSSPSAFWGTPLMGHLNYLGIDTIITCGESTSGCVRASVVDGCTNRYRMVVVEECVFDRHQASHAINLFDMHQKYADVLPLGEVLESLAEWRAGRTSRPARSGTPGDRLTRGLFIVSRCSSRSENPGASPRHCHENSYFMAMTGEDEKALPVMRITRHTDTRL